MNPIPYKLALDLSKKYDATTLTFDHDGVDAYYLLNNGDVLLIRDRRDGKLPYSFHFPCVVSEPIGDPKDFARIRDLAIEELIARGRDVMRYGKSEQKGENYG